MHHLAIFDFDGTITRKDSLLEFLKYLAGTFYFYVVFAGFLPLIIYYMAVKKEGWKAKRALLSYFLKGRTEAEIREIGRSFSHEVIPKIVLNGALEKIRWHLAQGHRVVVVSASLDVWLAPWIEEHSLELISTTLEFVNGRATGHFATPNCNGEEKVRRIKQYLELEKYDSIYAYGNSKGDLPMLSLADHRFMKEF